MPNDAKLGLVVGVGVVIAVAAVFFRKEALPALPAGTARAAAVASPKSSAPATSRTPSRSGRAKQSGDSDGNASVGQPAVRRHTVKDGDTLFGLAEFYYGDKEKSDLIFQANREVLQDADELPPGIRLVIPNAPQQSALEARPDP